MVILISLVNCEIITQVALFKWIENAKKTWRLCSTCDALQC